MIVTYIKQAVNGFGGKTESYVILHPRHAIYKHSNAEI